MSSGEDVGISDDGSAAVQLGPQHERYQPRVGMRLDCGAADDAPVVSGDATLYTNITILMEPQST